MENIALLNENEISFNESIKWASETKKINLWKRRNLLSKEKAKYSAGVIYLSAK